MITQHESSKNHQNPSIPKILFGCELSPQGTEAVSSIVMRRTFRCTLPRHTPPDRLSLTRAAKERQAYCEVDGILTERLPLPPLFHPGAKAWLVGRQAPAHGL